eukprot:c11930_g1_i1.p1 GENE.c11930_g1_i1~~c11930_g1_i1.p1  ORF type:complete len:196 (+),score=71.29 c11930_g1_i1:55-642(+)
MFLFEQKGKKDFDHQKIPDQRDEGNGDEESGIFNFNFKQSIEMKELQEQYLQTKKISKVSFADKEDETQHLARISHSRFFCRFHSSSSAFFQCVRCRSQLCYLCATHYWRTKSVLQFQETTPSQVKIDLPRIDTVKKLNEILIKENPTLRCSVCENSRLWTTKRAVSNGLVVFGLCSAGICGILLVKMFIETQND